MGEKRLITSDLKRLQVYTTLTKYEWDPVIATLVSFAVVALDDGHKPSREFAKFINKRQKIMKKDLKQDLKQGNYFIPGLGIASIAFEMLMGNRDVAIAGGEDFYATYYDSALQDYGEFLRPFQDR